MILIIYHIFLYIFNQSCFSENKNNNKKKDRVTHVKGLGPRRRETKVGMHHLALLHQRERLKRTGSRGRGRNHAGSKRARERFLRHR
jgi:hypothetical protein